MKGNLYLIPSTLGESEIRDVIPTGVLDVIHSLNYFIVENLRSARRFLLKSGYPKSINEAEFYVLDKHISESDISPFLDPCLKGFDIGILSEAGVPVIADPGANIIRLAHESGIRVIPLTGPSSILLALIASGLNGQNFTFHGYLPVKTGDLQKAIKEIETCAERDNQTQIFIETPYRNVRLFQTLIQTCKPSTVLCIATNITTSQESIGTKKISEWRKNFPDINGKPTVFLIGSGFSFNVNKSDIKNKGRVRPD